MSLKTVDFDIVSVGQLDHCKKLLHFFTGVSLKLHDLAVFLVCHHGTVTGELLLASSDQLLQIELGIYSLHSCQRFSAVTLLYTDMDNIVLSDVDTLLGVRLLEEITTSGIKFVVHFCFGRLFHFCLSEIDILCFVL